MTLVDVHPDQLRAAASDIDAVAALVARRDSRDPELGGLGAVGCSAHPALGAAIEAWSSYLRGLHDALVASANALRAAADAYRAADERAAVRQRHGGFFE